MPSLCVGLVCLFMFLSCGALAALCQNFTATKGNTTASALLLDTLAMGTLQVDVSALILGPHCAAVTLDATLRNGYSLMFLSPTANRSSTVSAQYVNCSFSFSQSRTNVSLGIIIARLCFPQLNVLQHRIVSMSWSTSCINCVLQGFSSTLTLSTPATCLTFCSPGRMATIRTKAKSDMLFQHINLTNSPMWLGMQITSIDPTSLAYICCWTQEPGWTSASCIYPGGSNVVSYNKTCQQSYCAPIDNDGGVAGLFIRFTLQQQWYDAPLTNTYGCLCDKEGSYISYPNTTISHRYSFTVEPSPTPTLSTSTTTTDTRSTCSVSGSAHLVPTSSLSTARSSSISTTTTTSPVISVSYWAQLDRTSSLSISSSASTSVSNLRCCSSASVSLSYSHKVTGTEAPSVSHGSGTTSPTAWNSASRACSPH